MPEITGPRHHSQAGALLSVEINCLNKQGAAMRVIDVQVHPFDRNHPGRPWASPSHGLDSATGDEMVAAMNSVGVEGAIMVSSFSAYEYDPSYALEFYNTYPDKFRVVTPVDASDPAIDDVVARWEQTSVVRCISIRM